MTLLTMILLLLITSDMIHAVQVGVIHNVALVMYPSNKTINTSSCNECLCIMLNVTGNASILSFNCYTNNNNTVSCELFDSSTYLNSYFYQMENNSNSIFYFQQLPSSIESETTTEVVMVTSSTLADAETTESPITTVVYPCASLRWNSTGITLVANGNGSNQVKLPTAVFIAPGNDALYIVDSGNNRIHKLEPGANSTTIVAGGQGAGRNATQLNDPIALFVDKNENIFVTDRSNYRVQVFANGSLFGQTILSNGTTNTPNNLIGAMFGISVDLANNLYISEYNYNRVLKLAPNVTNATFAAGDGIAGNSSDRLNNPLGIYTDPSTGTLYVANKLSYCIQKWLPGALNSSIVAGICGTPGSNTTLLNQPTGLTFDKYGNMYVVDGINVNSSRVVMFCPDSMVGIPIITSGLNLPQSVALDTNLNLYVADFNNNRVVKYEFL